jgi:hypothetical protein
MKKTIADLLKPGVELVRLWKDMHLGGRLLKRGEILELPRSDAKRVVDSSHGGYATRIEILELVGPIGTGSVEPGIGSVVEVPSWVALKLEREGKARAAKPLNSPPVTAFDAEASVKIQIAAPTKAPANRMGFYEPGLFIPELSRFCGGGRYRPERVPLSRRVAPTPPRSILVAPNALRPYDEGVWGDENGVMPMSRVVSS